MKRTLFVKIFIALMLLCSMGWGYTLTISEASGGTISPTGTLVVTAGTRVKITATPAEGHAFTSWSKPTNCPVDNYGSATTYVTVNGDCTIKPNFVLVYPLEVVTLGSLGCGSAYIIVSGSTSKEITSKPVQYLGVAKVSVIVNEGCRFREWSVVGDGKCTIANATETSASVTVRGACRVAARVGKIYEANITAESGGTVSPSRITGDAWDAPQAIKAVPNVGYRFVKWTSSSAVCPVKNETSAETEVGVYANCTVKASFVKTESLRVYASSGGKVSPSGYMNVDKGTVVDISATESRSIPSPYYFFDRWITSDASNCSVADETSAKTKVTVNGSCSVKANFVEGCIVSLNGDNLSVRVGDYISIEYVPRESYEFVRWNYCDGIEATTSSSAQNCTIEDPLATKTRVLVNGYCGICQQIVRVYDVSVTTKGGGTVSRVEERVPESTSLNITATPSDGYRFEKWVSNSTKCSIANASSASTTVMVNGSCTVTANFSKLGALSISAGEGGSVSPSGESYILSKNTITVTAEPDSGYAFNYWSASTSCNVESKNDKQLVATPTEGQNCNIKAFFQKTYQITIELWNNNAVIPSMRTMTEGYPVSVTYNMGNSHFLYREITPAENCPVSTNSGGIDYVTVRGDCIVRLYFTNFLELTSDFKEYDYSKNAIAGLGDEFRFHAAMENGSWYRVDVASEGAYAGAVLYYGSSQWEDDYGNAYPPVTECHSNDHNFSCYLKSVSDDGYLSVKSTESSKETIPFKIKIEKIDVTEVVVENMVRNKVVSERTVELGFGASVQVAADSISGYVFKEWKAVDGDCVLGDVQGKSIDVTTKSGKCRIRAVYDYDGNTNQYFGILQYFMYSYVSNCNYFGILDMNTEHRANSWANPTYNFVKYLDRSDFSLAIDGEPVALYFAGDSIDSFVGQRFEIPKLTDPMDSTLYFCFETPDEILNGDVHTFEFRSSFGGHDTTFVWDFTEYLAHLPDAPDTVAILAEGDSLGVTRTTKRVRIDVKTQNFSNDAWGVDAALYNVTDSLRVKVQCLNSGDEENLWLDLVEDGFYSIADLAKNEVYGKVGKNGAVKGDGVLGCAARDVIVAEFVDPIYKTVTRDTVAFGDVVPVDYQFLNEDLYRDIDSVEATEANFAFRLNMISPTVDKADTVMVVLFTDAGDSVWVSAVETDIYSNEFEGFGSFRFVTRKSDVRDDQLEAVMDLESDLNRVVIRMQIGADGSALNTRDSLVVFYQFIPADSAEIHDKDHDGRADFIRVHFAKSISNESLKIDSLFWGSATASGKNATASGRSVDAQSLVVSADGKWIEADLEEPFEYGVTSAAGTSAASGSAAGQGYLRISRKTSSVSQKVMLTDKVGAVPVSAVKRPGRLSDLDLLSGKTEMPFDTLVVTMSEPLDTMARLQCRSLRKAESGDSKDLCTAQEMFTFASEGRVRTVYKESYSRDKSGRVWTFVLPRNVNIRVGDVVRSNWRAFVEDAAGNAMGDGGVVVTGEDNDLYIYSIKAFPEVVGSGKAPRWFNPEKGESERMEGASIRVETRMAYDAAVSVFDNMGHVVSQFKHSFGKHGEKEDDAYVSDENATFVSFIRWDTKTLEKRLAGSGVYIWKIKFRFEDGHVEWRTIRSGIRR